MIVNKTKEEKAIDALALAGLSENALIAKLAAKYVDKPFDAEQCRAVIRSTYPDHGHLKRLSIKLWDERARQERIHDERKAVLAAIKWSSGSYTTRFLSGSTSRASEKRCHAQSQFGEYISSVFHGEILALMELATQDCRSYRVEWLDVGVRPAISALIKVLVEGEKGAIEERFLLYKVPGTSKACAVLTEGDSVKDAWSWQVPQSAMLFAQTQKIAAKRTDFDTQEIILVDADGDEQRFPWKGKAGDEP